MEKWKYLFVLSAVVALSGCASFSDMEDGLRTLMGKQEREAFEVLGYPSTKQQFGNDTVYVWQVSRSGVIMMPQTSTTTGMVGQVPVYGTTTYSQAMPVSYNCEIKLAANPSGTLISWDYNGNIGGCKNFIDRLDRYNKIRNPATTKSEDLTSEEKGKWAKVVASLNGCQEPAEVRQSERKGVREYFTVSCPNKTMEIQCEFIGPVYTGMKGLPFVKVFGKAYDNQPACWQ